MSPTYRRLWREPYPLSMVGRWVLMAFISGSVNAGGFMACSRFVTHVTGFATMFGLEAGSGNIGAAIGILSVPFFFLLGVMIGAYFTDLAVIKGRPPRFRLVMNIVAIALILAAVSGHLLAYSLFGSQFQLNQDYPLLVILSLASGLQNAALTTASGGIVRSTHMTGTTTDLGIGLVRVLLAGADPEVHRRDTYRNFLRIGTVVGFVLGGWAGAVLFNYEQHLGFLLPAALAVVVGDLGVGRDARQSPSPAVVTTQVEVEAMPPSVTTRLH